MAKSHMHMPTVKKFGLKLHRRSVQTKVKKETLCLPRPNLTVLRDTSHYASFSLARRRDPAVPLSHSWSQPAKKPGGLAAQVLLGIVVPGLTPAECHACATQS